MTQLRELGFFHAGNRPHPIYKNDIGEAVEYAPAVHAWLALKADGVYLLGGDGFAIAFPSSVQAATALQRLHRIDKHGVEIYLG